MKISQTIHCFLGVVLLTSIASGQTSPTLGVQLCAGVSITGTNAGLYAVQANSDLTNSNGWTCVGLVQLPATNCFWTDTAKSAASGQRFYRSVQTSTDLVYIQPGTFTMGSPASEALRGLDETQHLVTISRGFYMGKYLVTQNEYSSVVGSNPSYFTSFPFKRPVDSVQWADVTNYCAMRTTQEQAAGLIPTNWVYRLPTESEWEYACRAGTTTAFNLGDTLVSGQADFNGVYGYDAAIGTVTNSSGVFLNQTAKEGGYLPNAWGLYDMIGNDYEWCQDWYGTYPATGPGSSVIDPQGAATGPNHVLRGGGYTQWASSCRSACRFYITNPNTFRNTLLSFRVVLAQP